MRNKKNIRFFVAVSLANFVLLFAIFVFLKAEIYKERALSLNANKIKTNNIPITYSLDKTAGDPFVTRNSNIDDILISPILDDNDPSIGEDDAKINIVNFRSMAKKTRAVKRWLKRRSAIEPVIGHMKSDNGMARNLLKGIEGDKINALLSGCGFNMRKLLAVFFLPLIIWQKMRQLSGILYTRWIRFAV